MPSRVLQSGSERWPPGGLSLAAGLGFFHVPVRHMTRAFPFEYRAAHNVEQIAGCVGATDACGRNECAELMLPMLCSCHRRAASCKRFASASALSVHPGAGDKDGVFWGGGKGGWERGSRRGNKKQPRTASAEACIPAMVVFIRPRRPPPPFFPGPLARFAGPAGHARPGRGFRTRSEARGLRFLALGEVARNSLLAAFAEAAQWRYGLALLETGAESSQIPQSLVSSVTLANLQKYFRYLPPGSSYVLFSTC